MKIKKGDEVKIARGKDKGKTGKVMKVYPKENGILVEGLNLFKKHQRPRQADKKGEIVLVPKLIRVGNVRLVCPSCRRTTRVGYKMESGEKVRICKKCGKTV